MREILFRGKRIDNGEWVEGFYSQFHNRPIVDEPNSHQIFELIKAGVRFLNTSIGGFWHTVNPSTVGQYTGLTDKNGKKIFEGDLFRMDDDNVAVVIFKDGCFRLEVHGLCGAFTESGYDECGGGYGVIECEPIDWYYVRDMEVIGNIHDNPELLEVTSVNECG